MTGTTYVSVVHPQFLWPMPTWVWEVRSDLFFLVLDVWVGCSHSWFCCARAFLDGDTTEQLSSCITLTKPPLSMQWV